MTRLHRALLAIGLAVVCVGAAGVLSPAARADGDPGSDVLVYQNLFAAADANVAIAQQVELGDLLAAANSRGFTIRVAIIATPADLGAITQLWRKPASYAGFLGVELSLAYSQRLLVVMPDGFGFHWQGHSTSAGYSVLGKIAVRPGAGSGLATSAENAVRALAAASGVTLPPPSTVRQAVGTTPGAVRAAGGATGPAPRPAGRQQAAGHASDLPAWLITIIAAFALAAIAGGGLLSRRAGARRPTGPALGRLSGRVRALILRLRPRLAIPGTWLAVGPVAVAVALIIVHAAVQPTAGAAAAITASNDGVANNPNLDPGTPLSALAPNFTLTNQFGQPTSLRSYRGKVVILAFNDSECTTVCPMTTAALVDAKAMLGSAAGQVQLLGVEANPKATSVDDLLSYSQVHGMLYQWQYLTGSLSQLHAVWKDYSVGVTVNQNQIDHEPAIFVINQQGRLAKLYLTQLAYSAVPQLGQLLATEVSSLLPDHPAVRSHLSYEQVATIGPAAEATVPAAGGGYVSLGPGQPGEPRQARLYLFFATWDQEITSLGGQIDALNDYQSGAAAARLPGLTAVDEGSLEPSASALPNFLARLSRPLSYPVGIDLSGQIADGYGVQGEPWFVLVSPSGQPLWTWEVSVSGWPSIASIDRRVRAALAKTDETKATAKSAG